MSQPTLIKPPALRRGDAIGIVTPGRAAAFPKRVERGVREFERLGYRVKFGRHALSTSQTDAERVADIHDMFLDPDVRAILLSLAGEPDIIGGLLPMMDYDLIANHPTIFVGQSAASTLLQAIYVRTGLVTFHGPSLVQHFGNKGGIDDFTRSNFEAVLGGEVVAYPMSPVRADKFWDWDYFDEPRDFQPCLPWRTLRGGRASGPLLGGSLRAASRNLTSDFALDYEGAIFFWDMLFPFDTPPDVEATTRLMHQVQEGGVMNQIGGMVCGEPSLYVGADDLPGFDDVIRQHLMGDGARPVVSGADCGHTIPLLTFPLGVSCELNADSPRLRLLEPAVDAFDD